MPRDNSILRRPSFLLALAFFLAITLIEYLFMLSLNQGKLVYTLDDPYIHMAVAENILRGHYGVNLNEFSAPSSSVLWAFLIAPVSMFEQAPLVINIVCSVFSLALLIKILSLCLGKEGRRPSEPILSGLALLMILVTNLVGLVFTGMEHSLQLLLTLLLLYGIMIEVEEGRAPWWLPVAVVTAPLVRYECLTVSVAALVYLGLNRRYKPVILSTLVLLAALAAFAAFLMSLGLDALPNSVIAKSQVVQENAAAASVGLNILELMTYRQTFLLFLGSLPLVAFLFFRADRRRKLLAATTVLAIYAHLVAGRYGFYHRYEIYIWSTMLLVNIFLFTPLLQAHLLPRLDRRGRLALGAVVVTGFFISGTPYIRDLATQPIASNNIYEQQYQMHRFAVEYYNAPVAVNDLGYVAYKNDNFVLDLWGLGARKPLRDWLDRTELTWIDEVLGEEPIGLVMIYESHFEGIPTDWVKLGDLKLSRRRITPARSEVAFYATGPEAHARIAPLVAPFRDSLPPGVEFSTP